MRAILAAVALGVLCGVMPAQAHFGEEAPPGWNDWAGRQFSVRKLHCCQWSHAHLYPDAYTYNAGGSVTVTLQGQKVTIPADRFVDRERDPDDINPTGVAVVWYDSVDEAAGQIYCFDPPGPLI